MEVIKHLNVYGITTAFILCTILCLHTSHGLTASACYGTDVRCDYYDLKCPENQIIKLDNMVAGRKQGEDDCYTSNHCTYKDLCCSRQGEDPYESFTNENVYKTYTNCSGKQECLGMHAPWQLIQSIGSTSTYAEVNYNCIDADVPMNLCSPTPVKRTANKIELKFDGSSETYNPAEGVRNCQCQITSSSNNLIKMSSIDVRMPSFYRDENQTQECSSATFRSVAWVHFCINSQTKAHHELNFVNDLVNYVNAPSTVSLENIYQNGSRDAPAMVWFVFEGTFGNTFSMECQIMQKKNITSTPLTSTTSSTTTTTTTPTSTTSTTTTPSTISTTTPTTTTTTTTTTTPRPITSTSTTSTTSTTTTTQRPITSTSSTTTTSTTTTTTTTPMPIPSSSSTSTSTSTTTTTTTTAPRPLTSTSATVTSPTSTKSTPTKQTPQTSTSTTRTQSTRTPTPTSTTANVPTQRPVVPSSSPRPTTRASIVAAVKGDGVDDDTQKSAVLAAIIVPIVAFLLGVLAFILWICWTKTRSYRPSKAFKMQEDENPTQRPHHVYFATSNDLQL